MPSEHILKSFDEELVQLNTFIARMGELSQSQLSGAICALIERDAAMAARVAQADLEVDEIERELDTRAIKVLALRQPIARDLRAVLSALKIAAEFERICDYAANIAKRAIALQESAPDDLLAEIADLGGLARQLLQDVLSAFRTHDAAAALTVWAQDEQLDDNYAVIYRRLLDFMRTDAQHIAAGVHLLFIAKNIERIGDHATNIAESVYYLINGTPLTTPRPKGDKSSFNEVKSS